MAGADFNTAKKELMQKIDEQNFFLVESLKEQRTKLDDVKKELEKRLEGIVNKRTGKVDQVFDILNQEKANLDKKIASQSETLNTQNKKILTINTTLTNKIYSVSSGQDKISVDVKKRLVDFNAVLKDLTNKVDGFESVQKKSATGIIADVQRELKKLKSFSEKISSFNTTIETLKMKLDSIQNVEDLKISKLEEKIGKISDTHEQLKELIGKQEERGEESLKQTSDRFEDVKSTFEQNIAAEINRLNVEFTTKLSQLGKLRDEINSRLKDVQSSFSGEIKDKQKSTDKYVSTLAKQMDTLLADVSKLKTDVSKVYEKQSALDTKASGKTELQSLLKQMFDSKITAVQNQVNALNDTVPRLQESKKGEIARLSNQVNELKKTVENLSSGKIGKLESKFSEKIIELNSKFSEIDVVEHKIETIKEEMAKFEQNYVKDFQKKVDANYESKVKELENDLQGIKTLSNKLAEDMRVITDKTLSDEEFKGYIEKIDEYIDEENKTLRDELKGFDSKFEELKKQIAVINTSQAVMQKQPGTKDVLSLSKKVYEMDKWLTDVDKKVIGLEALKSVTEVKKIIENVASVKRDVYSLEKSFDSITAKVERLEKKPSAEPKIEEVRGELTPIVTAVTKLTSDLKAQKDGLAEFRKEYRNKLGDIDTSVLEKKVPDLVSKELKVIIDNLKSAYENQIAEQLKSSTKQVDDELRTKATKIEEEFRNKIEYTAEKYEKSLKEFNSNFEKHSKKVEIMGDKVDRHKSEYLDDLKLFREELSEKTKTYIDSRTKYFDGKYDKLFRRFTDLYLEYSDKLDLHKKEMNKYVESKLGQADSKFSELPEFKKKLVEELSGIVNKKYDEILNNLKIQSTKLTDEITLKSQKSMHDLEMVRKEVESSVNDISREQGGSVSSLNKEIKELNSMVNEVKSVNKKQQLELEQLKKEIKYLNDEEEAAKAEDKKKKADMSVKHKQKEEEEIKELLKAIK